VWNGTGPDIIDASTRGPAGWWFRGACVAVWIVFGLFRPGVDRFDRWLAGPCWHVPSLWHALADVTVNTGVVDPMVGGVAASVRRASVHQFVHARYAVAAMIELDQSHVSVIDEHYRVVGRFRRRTPMTEKLTERRRGLQALSHLWPVYDSYGDGRITTLVGFAAIGAGDQARGAYAYLALGEERNEVLFVCDVRTGHPHPRVLLVVEDVNGDGYDDLTFRQTRRKNDRKPIAEEPLAIFRWDVERRVFLPDVPERSRGFLSFWCATPDARLQFAVDEWLDEERIRMLPMIGDRTRSPGR
jgi:hypothetical protein